MQGHPLKLEPIYKRRIWGGQKLREVFGKDIPPFEKIGESWELSDLPEDKSIITNGEFAGRSLHDVVKEYPKQITGDEDFKLPFSLLIKFLDAEDILSVQVHPDEQTCRRMGKGNPKTECWYIISAAPDAVIYKGLKKGVTKERFAEAIKEGDVAELLQKVPVKSGECHFLPAGTAHSIGAGLLIAEIQTPSDTTYRVFDFNRVDGTGKARELHIKEALESIHFDVSGQELPVATVGRLADSQYFIIDKCNQIQKSEVLLSSGRMETMLFIKGSGSITSRNDEQTEFKAGDCVLIPASCEGVMCFSEETEYLTITI